MPELLRVAGGPRGTCSTASAGLRRTVRTMIMDAELATAIEDRENWQPTGEATAEYHVLGSAGRRVRGDAVQPVRGDAACGP
jgi:hypothetical protein